MASLQASHATGYSFFLFYSAASKPGSLISWAVEGIHPLIQVLLAPQCNLESWVVLNELAITLACTVYKLRIGWR